MKKRIKSTLPYQSVVLDDEGLYMCSVWTDSITELSDFCARKGYILTGERRCEFNPKKGEFTDINMNTLARYLEEDMNK